MNKHRIIDLLKHRGPALLMREADKVRKMYCGDEVFIRGIIEFSNLCARNCRYCGLRKSNKHLKRFRLEPDQIVRYASAVMKKGIKTVILQSGDDLGYKTGQICDVVSRIKERHPEGAITLSIGERPLSDYKAFKEAGADRYLIKHETIVPRLYKKLHPGQNLNTRVKILEHLRKLGYQVGTGFIVGLPGQTVEDLAEDLIFIRDFHPDMAGIGPFIPQKDTPLGLSLSGSRELVLKVLALARMLTRDTLLPATTALATVDPEEGHYLGLRAGANVIMLDETPRKYAKNYAIYDDRARVTLETAKRAIHRAGRKISFERGDSFSHHSARG